MSSERGENGASRMMPTADDVQFRLDEYDELGEGEHLRRHPPRAPGHVIIARGRRYDAGSIEAALSGAQQSLLSARPSTRLPLLEAAGFTVLTLAGWTLEDERRWRASVWQELQKTSGVVSTRWLKERNVRTGGRGISMDKSRTSALTPTGLAVSVRSTGKHYSDISDEHAMVYSYPRTQRPGRDRSEIEAVAALIGAELPLFVIESAGANRRVRLGWVTAADDAAQSFLFEFTELAPPRLQVELDPDRPFQTDRSRSRRDTVASRWERDPHFAFRVLHRYSGRCAITGVPVKQVLDAAHVMPVAKGGPDDDRNGLLLTATLHRAFDAGLWALHPSKLRMEFGTGTSAADLRLTSVHLRADVPPPHEEALEWRYEWFCRQNKMQSSDTQP
ncbi:HNH endonuclease [Cellulomonas sp. S1-8]|uniref:HNH endonuclease n=1 Tax=Cellulomonas sp. S1-8 TaxID=2904790 RepID=UPI002243F449|nr:HNH endonuclease [Cellulomonas sp. S1-8]UZN03066.1 HNH endonuclease [Cellulomonas sp. S1-8]